MQLDLRHCFFLGMMMVISAMSLSAQNPFEIKSRIGKMDSVKAVIPKVIAPDLKQDSGMVVGDTVSASNEVDTNQTNVEVAVPTTDSTVVANGSEQNPFELGTKSSEGRKEDDAKLKESLAKDPVKEVVKPKEEKNKPTFSIPDTDSGPKKYWEYVFGFLLIIGFAGLIYRDRETMNHLVRSVSNPNYIRTLFRTEYLKGKMPYFFFFGFFLIVGAFVLYRLAPPLTNNAILDYFLYLLILLGVYMLKFLILFIYGSLSELHHTFNLYTFLILLIGGLLGVALLPLVILWSVQLNQLNPWLLYIIGGLILIAYLLRTFLGFRLFSLDLSKHKFHFFIYFCGVELIPMLLVAKNIGII